MKRTILYILFLSLIYTQTAWSQQARRLTGLVTSTEDSQPLPGVSVTVKGTTQGSVTNAEGGFELNVNNGRYLVFSLLGYEPQEIFIDGIRKFEVKLKPKGAQLGDVQIIGSRNANRTKLNSAVPVDIIDIRALQESAPQVT